MRVPRCPAPSPTSLFSSRFAQPPRHLHPWLRSHPTPQRRVHAVIPDDSSPVEAVLVRATLHCMVANWAGVMKGGPRSLLVYAAVGLRSRTQLLLFLSQLRERALARAAKPVEPLFDVSRACDLRASARDGDVLVWIDKFIPISEVGGGDPGDPWPFSGGRGDRGAEDAIAAVLAEGLPPEAGRSRRGSVRHSYTVSLLPAPPGCTRARLRGSRRRTST